jgi:hypothetical protein
VWEYKRPKVWEKEKTGSGELGICEFLFIKNINQRFNYRDPIEKLITGCPSWTISISLRFASQ